MRFQVVTAPTPHRRPEAMYSQKKGAILGKQISLGLKIFSVYSPVCFGKAVSLASLPLSIQILLLSIWNTAEICPDAAVIWDSPEKSPTGEPLPSENSLITYTGARLTAMYRNKKFPIP